MCSWQLPSRHCGWQAAAGTALLLGLLCQELHRRQEGKAVLRVLLWGALCIPPAPAARPARQTLTVALPSPCPVSTHRAVGSCSPWLACGAIPTQFLSVFQFLAGRLSRCPSMHLLPLHCPGRSRLEAMDPPSFQEAAARVEEWVCMLLQDTVCRDRAASVAQRGGGDVHAVGCDGWGTFRSAQWSGAVPGQYTGASGAPDLQCLCREPGAVLGCAVSNGPTPVSLG